MKAGKSIAALAAGLVPIALFADIKIVSPKGGEVVPQLWPEQIAFVEMSREGRKACYDNGDRTAFKALRARKAEPKPVAIQQVRPVVILMVKFQIFECMLQLYLLMI